MDSEFNESQGQLSPDGRWLAYTSDLTGQFEVYLQGIDGSGGRVRVSVSGGHSPRWDPAAEVRTLYYVAAGRSGPAPLTRVRVRADGTVDAGSRGSLFELTDTNPEYYANYAVRPNGEEIIHIEAGDAGGRELIWVLNWPQILEQLTNEG